MNAVSIIGLIFSGFVLLCSVITIIFTNRRNLKKDTQEDTEKMSELSVGIMKANIKLEQICSTTTQTQSDVRQMSEVISKHGERILSLEKDVELLKRKLEV
jgi:peptidoglycan hydrolase CwlO-like protein